MGQIPSLKQNSKQKLLSASAKALKACMKYSDTAMSFDKICEVNCTFTPDKLMM